MITQTQYIKLSDLTNGKKSQIIDNSKTKNTDICVEINQYLEKGTYYCFVIPNRNKHSEQFMGWFKSESKNKKTKAAFFISNYFNGYLPEEISIRIEKLKEVL